MKVYTNNNESCRRLSLLPVFALYTVYYTKYLSIFWVQQKIYEI